MRCQNCQNELRAGQRFCGRCGSESPEWRDSPSWRDVDPGVAPAAPAARVDRPRGFTEALPGYPSTAADISLPQTALEYASWWSRVVALIVDVVLLFLVVTIVIAVLGIGPTRAGSVPVAAYAVSFVLSAAYFSFTAGGSSGQTLGYRMMGMRVRDERSGGPIGVWRAFLRYLFRSVLYLLLVIPGLVNDLFPLWDARRQTLADKVFHSVVVRTY